MLPSQAGMCARKTPSKRAADALDVGARAGIARVGLERQAADADTSKAWSIIEQLGLGVDVRALRGVAEPGPADLDGVGPVRHRRHRRARPLPALDVGEARGEKAGPFFLVDAVGFERGDREVPLARLRSKLGDDFAAHVKQLFAEVEPEVE